MPRILKRKPNKGKDLGSLQQELERIAKEEQELRERETQLAKDKAEVEEQLTSTLQALGLLDHLSPRTAKQKPGRKPKADAPAKAKAPAKARAGSKRYSDEEKQAAVAFVQARQQDNATITQAIDEFNKEAKPRGKAKLNYQNYKRWVEA